MSEATETKRPQWIRQAVDFGALLAFMAAYFITRDMIKATWVLVVASMIALAVGFVLERRLAPMPLITGGFALVFGALTILTDDDLFVKLKLTVQNGLLAAVLLGSIPLNKSPFKALLGSAIQVTDEAWRKLTFRYGIYFLCVALANEVFRSPEAVTAIWSALNLGAPDPNGVWTAFRGVLWIAASIFGLCQVPLIMKNMIKDEEPGPISPDTGL
ncbi:inner membrane-spanning protein YciB [Brevundimonas sp.]|uniref:inner membrane-spanning protein YciB n=1 Tax=Brevundimonas sp. TaxID=1871086 RepID=UPI003D6D0DF9